ncbi:replication initiation protein [Bacillus albus]|uniref:replication initiation protein n=1 Tax=Bacillus cereus group TaxID=86661 RepID=UPI001C120425|nr:replication initiation protein [Bacillus albus]MBU5220715.1 replication initiation protein [Bacillus albus]
MATSQHLQILQIKENNIVSKSNTLIEANSRLNLVEQKIILCLASNIEPNDRDFKTYRFPIKKFHHLLGLKGSTKYTELSKITKELLSKVIEIRIGEEVIQVSWLSSAIYNKNKGIIDMRFDPLLKPFLLELSSQFTSYKLANIVKLKSTYAIRLYELLKQYEDIKERTISLENLRYYLDAIDLYIKYGNFKQRVLIPAQVELNEKTDISFEFEEIKLGRKVQKIKFTIRSRKKKKQNIMNFARDFDEHQSPNSFEQKLKQFEDRCKERIFPNVLKKWSLHKGMVLEIIEEIQFRSDISSPIGYVEYMLNSRLEKSLHKNSKVKLEAETKGGCEIDSILNSVIGKYSSSTGAIATFLVEEKAIKELTRLVTLEKAKEIWKNHEKNIMEKIHECIKKNKRKKY